MKSVRVWALRAILQELGLRPLRSVISIYQVGNSSGTKPMDTNHQFVHRLQWTPSRLRSGSIIYPLPTALSYSPNTVPLLSPAAITTILQHFKPSSPLLLLVNEFLINPPPPY